MLMLPWAAWAPARVLQVPRLCGANILMLCLLQVPRLYNVYKEQGLIENFEQVKGMHVGLAGGWVGGEFGGCTIHGRVGLSVRCPSPLHPASAPRSHPRFCPPACCCAVLQLLSNIFTPLFEVTRDPNSHPQLHLFLKGVSPRC